MAPRKKTEPQVSVSNVNNNTNHIKVDLKLPKSRKPKSKKQEKPNWILKAVLLTLIGAGGTILVYFMTQDSDHQNNKPAVIENTRSSTGNF